MRSTLPLVHERMDAVHFDHEAVVAGEVIRGRAQQLTLTNAPPARQALRWQITGGGLPLTIVDPNSVTTTLTYDPRQHLLTSTTASHETTYGYDAAENLTSVTQPDGSGLTYSYDSAHRLTGITDILGQSISSSLDALGDSTSTDIRNATGTVTSQHSDTFDALGRMLKDIGAASQTSSFTYDAMGNMHQIPLQPSGGANFYDYTGNDPANAIDPSGLRWIVVTIWNRQGTSVGHAAGFELNGNTILSEFPQCHCLKAPLLPPQNWSQTLQREGRSPNEVFKVWIPDDAGFNKAAAQQSNMPTWDWNPNEINQTSCVKALSRALNAGGVPAPSDLWPGNFGDWLSNQARNTQLNKGYPYPVLALPGMPWK